MKKQLKKWEKILSEKTGKDLYAIFDDIAEYLKFKLIKDNKLYDVHYDCYYLLNLPNGINLTELIEEIYFDNFISIVESKCSKFFKMSDYDYEQLK